MPDRCPTNCTFIPQRKLSERCIDDQMNRTIDDSVFDIRSAFVHFKDFRGGGRILIQIAASSIRCNDRKTEIMQALCNRKQCTLVSVINAYKDVSFYR